MAVVAMLATTIPSVLFALLGRDREPAERWERLATVAELNEQDVIYIPRWGIFLVAEPHAPIALYALSPRAPSGDGRLLFCPSSGHFEAMQHGETFDRRGIHVAGRAPRGMDGFDVRITNAAIEVDVIRLYRGAPRGAQRPVPATGPSCGDAGFIEVSPGFWGDPRSVDATV